MSQVIGFPYVSEIPVPNPEGTEREPLMKVWNTGSGGGRRADERSKADLDKGGGGRCDWEGGGCEEVGVIVRKVDVIGREGKGGDGGGDGGGDVKRIETDDT